MFAASKGWKTEKFMRGTEDGAKQVGVYFQNGASRFRGNFLETDCSPSLLYE